MSHFFSSTEQKLMILKSVSNLEVFILKNLQKTL